MTPEQLLLLPIARGLAAAGIQVRRGSGSGPPDQFQLPQDWQHTRPIPGPSTPGSQGMALGLVTGHGWDLTRRGRP